MEVDIAVEELPDRTGAEAVARQEDVGGGKLDEEDDEDDEEEDEELGGGTKDADVVVGSDAGTEWKLVDCAEVEVLKEEEEEEEEEYMSLAEDVKKR